VFGSEVWVHENVAQVKDESVNNTVSAVLSEAISAQNNRILREPFNKTHKRLQSIGRGSATPPTPIL
jgi:hypothetical protein